MLSRAVWDDGWNWNKGETGLGHSKLQAVVTGCQGHNTYLPEGWGAPQFLQWGLVWVLGTRCPQ